MTNGSSYHNAHIFRRGTRECSALSYSRLYDGHFFLSDLRHLAATRTATEYRLGHIHALCRLHDDLGQRGRVLQPPNLRALIVLCQKFIFCLDVPGLLRDAAI